MKGELAAEFLSNALPEPKAAPLLSAEFGAAATTDSANLKRDEEFVLSQKAHVLEQGGSTNDDRVRRYAELMGTGIQQQGERKDKDERSLRTQLALRSQAELRERLDSMRADLGRKIDQRISVVEQLLAAAQKALTQAQNEHERLVGIQEQIVQEGYWKLSAEDQAFLEKTAGKDVVDRLKKHDPVLEKARDASERDPQSKEKKAAFDREADQSRAITQPVVEEKKAEAQRAGRDVADLQAEKERLEELKKLAFRKTDFDTDENGRFKDPLVQRAAERAGISPSDYDSENKNQRMALVNALNEEFKDIDKLINGQESELENKAIVGVTAPGLPP